MPTIRTDNRVTRRAAATPASITLDFNDIFGDASNVAASVVYIDWIMFQPTGAAAEIRCTVTQTTGLSGADQVRWASMHSFEYPPDPGGNVRLRRENGTATIAVAGAVASRIIFIGHFDPYL